MQIVTSPPLPITPGPLFIHLLKKKKRKKRKKFCIGFYFLLVLGQHRVAELWLVFWWCVGSTIDLSLQKG